MYIINTLIVTFEFTEVIVVYLLNDKFKTELTDKTKYWMIFVFI